MTKVLAGFVIPYTAGLTEGLTADHEIVCDWQTFAVVFVLVPVVGILGPVSYLVIGSWYGEDGHA